ncbi:hypothetical protein AQZ52_01075 [Novosphingobium fuchskuhlense]|uniref:TonB C-terminal domain-containing protein n=1 Tax=Novosphingobium fuchskuhlense TaxID=1117702 RepID=A0A124JWQ8_9SPHN|nr:energy transducer TonB [Novosphingobium fuchskuhlense]KUR73595.1 hypothetical protein AQZ52_01075 [Novosphingobium fuchskuhlense]
MAYVTPETNHRRIVALGAVGAVHGVMALAILTGFAGGMIQRIERHALKDWTFMPPPTPKPTTEPASKVPPRTQDTKPTPDVLLPQEPLPGSEVKIDLGPIVPAGGEIGPGPLLPTPTASASPTFTPRTAAPLGMPGMWVSPSDYPSSALHRGQQGVTGFELTISPDGRVRDCRITRSSGSADLDAATCARVSERARFNPARDEHGNPVVGRYANKIRWQIPE